MVTPQNFSRTPNITIEAHAKTLLDHLSIKHKNTNIEEICQNLV